MKRTSELDMKLSERMDEFSLVINRHKDAHNRTQEEDRKRVSKFNDTTMEKFKLI